MPPFLPRLTSLLGVLALAGCASLGPDYQPPQPKLADSWQAALPHQGSTTSLLNWWQSFNDPTLSALLAAAEADSPSLAKAAAAIASARASQDSSAANALPSLNVSAKASRSGTAKADSTTVSNTSLGALDASWEIDLFGALGRQQEAADARSAASEADWHEARVSLAAEVASEYVQYRACQLLSASDSAHLVSLQQTARSTASAVSAGLSAPADADLAQASVASAAASLTQQRAECDLNIKALVALTGLSEAALRTQLGQEVTPLPQPAELSVSSVPVQLLSQRPDLVAAERSLAAASAEIGQAEANRYPRLSLLGSVSLSRVHSGGQASETAPWSFGPSLSLPLFDGGAGKAAVRSAQASYASSLASYQQAVRDAVKEVEQALVRLASANARVTDVAQSATGYRRYFSASEQLWRAGGSSLLNLEQSRRDALSAEQNLIGVQRDRVLYGIALYKALGGGWQTSATPSSGDSR
ncbi:efflux transporter outer membrane subunit [Chitinimonas taiwanensis]|uniref:efflux transporter outer membrane subunit n=1 Tax=Chitinimonas taiwanensis TaxID=240412 RepID=UPI0035B1960F